MTRLRAMAAFAYDFLVGDDPVIAVVVVVALGLTAAVGTTGTPSWWVMPCSVVVALVLSMKHSTPR